VKKAIIVALSAAAVFGSCGSGAKRSGQSTPVAFQSATVPVMITDPMQQAEYMAAHWWDHFDFTDTAFLRQPAPIEQAFVDYVAVLPHIDPAKAEASIRGTMRGAAADTAVFGWFRRTAEHYLWDPNSPMRNETLYIAVLEAVTASGADPLVRQRADFQLAQALKNRPGAPAADFAYTLASGRGGRLSQLRGEYTLLFFNNPGCSTCAQIIAQIGASPVFGVLIDGRPQRMQVLAVYTDEDMAAWHEHLAEMPANWLVSASRAPAVEDLYDLRAIPTMYLLDAEKKVLLKDPTFEQLEAYLVQLNN